MEKILTTNATPNNALLPAHIGAADYCRCDGEVPNINLQDEPVKKLFREIGLGREFRLNLEPIYCVLYHIIKDKDTPFEKEDLMHWCLLIPLMISLGCTENTEAKERFKCYFDLFHYWFPHEFEECTTFKKGGMKEMTKQLRNGNRDKKIVVYKDMPPSKWTDEIYRKIDKFKKVVSRFEDYLKEYNQKKLKNLIPMR